MKTGATLEGPAAATANGESCAAAPVRRRHLFFIAGFDPKSPRWYQALYRKQARRQQKLNGLTIRVEPQQIRPTAFSTAWQLHAAAASGTVETVHEMLQWDDIVRRHWSHSAWRVLFDGLRSVIYGLRDGAVQRMYRLFRPPVYATFLPLVVLALCVSIALALGLGVAHLLADGEHLAPLPAYAVGVFIAAALLAGSVALVHRIQITWLLRLVRFTVLQAQGRVPELEKRLSQFANRVAEVASARPEAGSDPVDEILIVGHSVGATLAIGLIARLLERMPDLNGDRYPRLSLLSLGHCIPLLSALGPAQALRNDLQRVADSDIDWLDISAPIDWAAFPGIDPVSAAGLQAAAADWHPKMLSPRFHKLFGHAAYARLKRNRFQVHLQYLMASERPGAYDYFAITAGTQRLRERFD